MFGIFEDKEFKGFWINQKEDEWAASTVKKMKLKDAKIFWYEGLTFSPELYRFNEDFNLVIQKLEDSNLVDDEIYTAEAYSY